MVKFIVDSIIFLLNFTLPASLILLLLLFVFIFYHKRASRYLLAMTIILFYLAASGVIPRLLIKPLENDLYPTKKRPY